MAKTNPDTDKHSAAGNSLGDRESIADSSEQISQLVRWPTSKLFMFGVLLPIVGCALFAATMTFPIWDADSPIQSLLIYGWMGIVGFWSFGFAGVLWSEIRRRRHFSSPAEIQLRADLRRADLASQNRKLFAQFQTGLWWFAVTVFVAIVLVIHAQISREKADWGTLIGLPMAVSLLYWMNGMKIGLGLWIAEKRASRWLAFCFVGLFSIFCLGYCVRHFGLV